MLFIIFAIEDPTYIDRNEVIDKKEMILHDLILSVKLNIIYTNGFTCFSYKRTKTLELREEIKQKSFEIYIMYLSMNDL